VKRIDQETEKEARAHKGYRASSKNSRTQKEKRSPSLSCILNHRQCIDIKENGILQFN
jgi:hypothetical protein